MYISLKLVNLNKLGLFYWWTKFITLFYPANIYLLKFNDRNTRKDVTYVQR